MTNQSPRGWHVLNWGTWGWIETGLKEIALAAGVAGYFATNGLPLLALSANPKPLVLILLGLLNLGMVFQLGFRIWQRELISIAFAVTMLLGHLALTAAFMRAPELRVYGIVFAVFMVLGDLAKQRFFAVTGYTEGIGRNKQDMAAGHRVVIVAYIILGILFSI